MKKTLKPCFLVLIIVLTEVQSYNIMEEILRELKDINQKVDLLSEKADNNQQIIEIIREEVRKNMTHLDFSLEIVKNDMKSIKMLEENSKENSEILKNEIPAVKENVLTLNSNIGNVEQEIIKTKSEMKSSYNKIFDKVDPLGDEIKRGFERFDNTIKLLNQTIEENSLKAKSIELQSITIQENVNKIESLVKSLVYGTVFLSSEGIGAEKQGNRLGQYQYNKYKKHFEQMNTEKNNEKYVPKYLYQTASMDWWVGEVSGKEKGGLRNKNKTEEPEDIPLSDWLVNADDTWQTDPTLTITIGPLLPSCFTIKVEATGPAADLQSSRLGEFKLSKKWFNGLPIYEKEDGQMLHMMNDGHWGVSTTLGSYGIRGSPGYLCPTKSTKWEYFDWKSSKTQPRLGDITVTCSKNQ